MNESKIDLLEESLPSTCPDRTTYKIYVNDGIISNHPNYVRPGDHVDWELNNVDTTKPFSVNISGSLFQTTNLPVTAGPRKVQISAVNVNVAPGTTRTYSISGTRYVGTGTTTVPFTTAVTNIMVDNVCCPPGCAGCSECPGGGGGEPEPPRGPRRRRHHQLAVTAPV